MHADDVLDSMDIQACCRIHFITAPVGLSEMCVQMSNEKVFDNGCEVTETIRPPEDAIRVQRVKDRAP